MLCVCTFFTQPKTNWHEMGERKSTFLCIQISRKNKTSRPNKTWLKCRRKNVKALNYIHCNSLNEFKQILTHTHKSMAVMYHDEMMEMLTHHTENCRDRKKPKWSRKPHVNNKLNLVETFGNDFGPVRLFTVWKNLMQNKLATVTENEVEFGAFTYSILISGWLNVLQTESHIYMTLWSLLRSKMAVVELWTLSNAFLFSSHRSLTTSCMSFAV